MLVLVQGPYSPDADLFLQHELPFDREHFLYYWNNDRVSYFLYPWHVVQSFADWPPLDLDRLSRKKNTYNILVLVSGGRNLNASGHAWLLDD